MTFNVEKTALQRATEAWDGELPEWVGALVQHADATSQGQVARRMGISGAQVSQIINNKYKGSLVNAEEKVRGRLMKMTVSCPALGEVMPETCRSWRKAVGKKAPPNGQWVRMKRACRQCPRNVEEPTDE